MINTIFFWTFTLFGMINFVHMGAYIIGANTYDIAQLRRKKRLQQAAEPFEPLLTVLVPAHNEELGIIRTLDTISKSTYKNIAIVVVDDASTDKTSKLVQSWIKEKYGRIASRFTEKDGKMTREYYRVDTSTPPTCLVTMPVNSGKGAGLNYALRRVVHGGLVMTLDADSMLEPDAIANAVSYFRDPKIVGVAANVKIMEQRSVLGILQKFEHMIGYYSKKFYSVAHAEFIIGGVASTYRYETIRDLDFYDTDTSTEDIGLSMKIVSGGNRNQQLVYAADVVASTEGVQTLKGLLKQRYRWKMGSLQNLIKYNDMLGNVSHEFYPALTLYRIPMAFFSEVMLMTQPLILGYIFYLSILYHTLGFLIGAYLTITAFVLCTLWPDEHHSTLDKIRLSLYAPALYFCFYIMDFIQVAAIVRCLGNYKQLTERSTGHVTWVSPERVGGSA
jgi:biofilm PGA synthesis N-glycosyltransferase PgaC